MNEYAVRLEAVLAAIDDAVKAVERAVLAAMPETGVTRDQLITLGRAYAKLSEIASDLRLFP